MSQALYYPSPSLTLSAIGANGQPIPTTSLLVAGTDGTDLRPLLTDASGHLIIDNTTTGGATAANQVLEITQLTGIHSDTTAVNGKLPASLGAKLAAASLSIVLASDGTLPLPTGAATSANQATEIASLASIDSKLTSPLTVTGPLTDTQLRASAVPVSAASLPLPTGAATEATLSSIDTKTPALGQALAASSVPVVLTAAQLSTLTPLSSVTVSGTVAATQSGTWNITNVSGSVSLPTGAATETTVAAINTKTPALGQALAAASVPVVLTAAQLSTLTPLSTIAATQSGTWTVQPGNTANTTAWLVNSVAKTPTAGTVTQAAITVGTSAVRLTVSGSAPSATRSVLMAIPDSASTASFYIGSASVTNSGATRGIQIVAGQPFIANSDAGDYYIVASTASQTVYVTEQA